MNSLLAMYMIGIYAGRFFSGCLIFGTIPLIVAFVKKRWGIGLAAFFLCGLAGLFHQIASLVVGIVFLICAIGAGARYAHKIDYTVSWKCQCGRIHKNTVSVCPCGLTKENQATPQPSAKSSAAAAKEGWTCSCGRSHADYVSSCPCGKDKRDL